MRIYRNTHRAKLRATINILTSQTTQKHTVQMLNVTIYLVKICFTWLKVKG